MIEKILNRRYVDAPNYCEVIDIYNPETKCSDTRYTGRRATAKGITIKGIFVPQVEQCPKRCKGCPNGNKKEDIP